MPNKRTGEPTKDERLAVVISRLLDEDKHYLNNQMADIASKELGESVDKKDISRVRNKIGRGWHVGVIHDSLKYAFDELRAQGWTIDPPKHGSSATLVDD